MVSNSSMTRDSIPLMHDGVVNSRKKRSGNVVCCFIARHVKVTIGEIRKNKSLVATQYQGGSRNRHQVLHCRPETASRGRLAQHIHGKEWRREFKKSPIDAKGVSACSYVWKGRSRQMLILSVIPEACLMVLVQLVWTCTMQNGAFVCLDNCCWMFPTSSTRVVCKLGSAGKSRGKWNVGSICLAQMLPHGDI